MKKITYVALFACLFSFATIIHAESSVNLINNSSLENASAYSSNYPDSWDSDFAGNSEPVFSYPVPGHTGSAAKIDVSTKQTSDSKWYFDPVPVTPGANYNFRYSYKSDVPTKVMAQFTMSNGRFQNVDLGSVGASPSDWNQFTASFLAPAGAVQVSVFPRLMQPGSLTVDDFSLTDPSPGSSSSNSNSNTNTNSNSNSSTDSAPIPTPVTPVPDPIVPVPIPAPAPTPVPTPSPIVSSVGPNLISNPSAESQTGGVPDGWFTDIEGATTATFSVVPGHNGGSAVQTNLTVSDPAGGDAKWIWAPVPVTTNADYVFSQYYKSDYKSVVIVEFNMSDGTRQFTNLITLPPATDWTRVDREFNVRPGTVSVTVFDVLRGVGTLTVDDVSLSQLSNGSFAQGLVSLSFDDGATTFYDNALPLLMSGNFAVSQNIVNDFIGTTDYMTESQIAQINKDGVEIGSHSLSHPYLTSLSDADATNEIQNSRAADLSAGLSPVSIFAYPYGDWDGRVEDIIKASGYIGARATDLGFNTRNSDPYDLRTENVEANTTLAQVQTWVDEAIANKTWLILAFHDVSNTPIDEYTITPSTLQSILNYLAQSRVQVATTDYVVKNLMK